MIAALFVETNGVYFNIPGIDPWDQKRDARNYTGPYPVIAHPPCQRWGKMRMGQPLWIKRTGERKIKGDDNGCFASAIASVRQYGYTCCVEQGGYGHYARKPTMLYVVGTSLPELKWGVSSVRLDPVVVARMGLKRARRLGEVGARGGGRDSSIRNATPVPFREILINLARSCYVPDLFRSV